MRADALEPRAASSGLSAFGCSRLWDALGCAGLRLGGFLVCEASGFGALVFRARGFGALLGLEGCRLEGLG